MRDESRRLILALILLLVAAAAMLVFIFSDATDPWLVIPSLAVAFIAAVAGMLLFFKATGADSYDRGWKTRADLPPGSRRLINWTNGVAGALILVGAMVWFDAPKDSYQQSTGYFLAVSGSIIPYIAYRLLRKR